MANDLIAEELAAKLSRLYTDWVGERLSILDDYLLKLPIFPRILQMKRIFSYVASFVEEGWVDMKEIRTALFRMVCYMPRICPFLVNMGHGSYFVSIFDHIVLPTNSIQVLGVSSASWTNTQSRLHISSKSTIEHQPCTWINPFVIEKIIFYDGVL